MAILNMMAGGGGNDMLDLYNFESISSYHDDKGRLISVPYGFFSSNQRVTSVFLPVCSVIASYGFTSCPNLKTIDLPNVKIIYSFAFASCGGLESINLPNCENLAGQSIFWNVSTVSYTYLPKCISISSSAFATFKTYLYLPEFSGLLSGTHFGRSDYQYSSYVSITGLHIPKVDTIGFYTFYGAAYLSEFIAENCTVISGAAFQSAGNQQGIALDLPAYSGNSSGIFTQYIFGRSTASSLYSSSTSFCKVRKINIPKVKSIYTHAFYSASLLEEVRLADCSALGSSAFNNCKHLISLYMLGSFIPTVYMSALHNTPIFNSTMSYSGKYGSIFVLPSMLEAFKTAPYWSDRSARIYPYEG